MRYGFNFIVFQEALPLSPKVLDASSSQRHPNFHPYFGLPTRFLFCLLICHSLRLVKITLTHLSVERQYVFVTSFHSLESAQPHGGQCMTEYLTSVQSSCGPYRGAAVTSEQTTCNPNHTTASSVLTEGLGDSQSL